MALSRAIKFCSTIPGRNLQIVIDVAFKYERTRLPWNSCSFVKAETKKDGIDFTYAVAAISWRDSS